uniref:helix-turn-helix domain-containing protein n=1 Tax=Microlunatus parietis TaxID=682979 RepID=UPI0035E44856
MWGSPGAHSTTASTGLLGRTVHAEIVRVRMARVTEFLTSTDWTLARIAERLDFKHAEYMGVLFKRHTGRSPGAYRRIMASA